MDLMYRTFRIGEVIGIKILENEVDLRTKRGDRIRPEQAILDVDTSVSPCL